MSWKTFFKSLMLTSMLLPASDKPYTSDKPESRGGTMRKSISVREPINGVNELRKWS